jgi:type IV pilus assembly protein PilA
MARFDTGRRALDNCRMTQPGGPPQHLVVEPGQPLPATASKLSGRKMLLIVLAIVALCGLPVIGVLSALAIYGVKKYVTHAKGAEAVGNVQKLASGIARCANEVDSATTRPRGLPASSAPVPATLGAVSGAKYQSTAGEWRGAFTCAGFAVTGPQYFQYRWDLRSPTSGVATAVADLDGDGSVDATAEQPVTCAPSGTCTVGAFTKTPP